jgi:chemotaxis protein CheX
MESSRDKLELVTANLFEAVLELYANPCSEPTSVVDSSFTTSSVQITGHWQGVVSLTVPNRFASLCSSRMFAIEASEVTLEHIEDAMGELANITAGSFKSMLEGSCQLGLPVVTHGSNYSVRFPGASVDCRVDFTCEEMPFFVTLLVRST